VRDPRLRVNDPRTLRQYALGIHDAVSGIDGEWTSRKQLASAAIRRHTVSQLKNVFKMILCGHRAARRGRTGLF
jgi:hypothetical protein